MSTKINNSIINNGSTIGGSVTLNVSESNDTSQLIKDLEEILLKGQEVFNQRELSQLEMAKKELATGDTDSAKSTLKYFKSAISDITKLTTSNILAGFLLNL